MAVVIITAGIFLLGSVVWVIFFNRPEKGLSPAEKENAQVAPGGKLPENKSGNGANLSARGGRLQAEIDKLRRQREQNGSAAASNTAQGGLTKVRTVLDGQVKAVNYNGQNLLFLNEADNKFYALSSDGKKILLSEESFPFVDKVVWSADNNKAVLEYPDGSNLLYDFSRRKKIMLPSEGEGFAFDKSAKRLAYKIVTNNEDSNWLVVSDIQTQQVKPIEPIGNKSDSVEVNWSPNNQVVALYHEPRGLDSEEVYFLGLRDENFKSLKVNGSNFKGVWSPNGQWILYHVINSNNNYNPVLWIASASGDKIGNYNYNLHLNTWVDKCVFTPDSQAVYCAVPTSLKEGAGLYPELVGQGEDVFYKIDLKSGLAKLIAYPVLNNNLSKFQVQKLFISRDGTRLYFWDKLSQKVYSLRLR